MIKSISNGVDTNVSDDIAALEFFSKKPQMFIIKIFPIRKFSNSTRKTGIIMVYYTPQASFLVS